MFSKRKIILSDWVGYFFTVTKGWQKLKVIDGWVRNRLRYCIWKDWKKPDRRKKNFIRLGVETGMAYAWSRSRMGGWAIACSPIMGTTVTIARLEQRGYISFFYLITGLHALHIIGGIAAIIIAMMNAFLRPFALTERRKIGFKLVLHYWHFVDVLWIYLLVFLLLVK